MRSMIEAISQLDFYRDQVPVLHDMRLVNFDVPMEHVQQVARMQPSKPRQTRLALVAGSALGFGMLRALATFRENDRRVAAAFHSVEEALSWLELPGLERAIPKRVESLLAEPFVDGAPCHGFGLVSRKLTG